VTYQRDIGFHTTAEAAYVGIVGVHRRRSQDVNRPKNNLYLLADPSRMFNGNAIPTTCSAPSIPGMGTIQKWFDAKDGYTVNNNILRYNSLQLNVQRRLNRGLQMGLAYTEARGMAGQGIRRTSWMPILRGTEQTAVLGTDEQQSQAQPGGELQLPHPECDAGHASGEWLLGDWQISGVTKFLSGAATQPSCGTNNSGIANTNPRSRRARRSPVVHGRAGVQCDRDPNLAKKISCTSTRGPSPCRSR
jgi:hypothetical protein